MEDPGLSKRADIQTPAIARTSFVRAMLGVIGVACLCVCLTAEEAPPLKLLQTIPMPQVKGRLDHMFADVKGQKLFVAGLENGSVEVLDLRAGKWSKSIPGFKKPQGVWYVPQLNKLFVASGDDGMLRVFALNGATPALEEEISLGLGANRIAYDSRLQRMYVGFGGKDAGKDYGEVAILNAKTGDLVDDVKVLAHPAELLLDKSGSTLFVFIPIPSNIQVLDTKTLKVRSSWPVSNRPVSNQRPGDAALDDGSHRLMVGTRTPPEMVVLDSITGKQIANLPTGEGMDGVYFDRKRKRIYVSGGRGFDVGFVYVYQQDGPDQYRTLGKVPTRPGAGTSLWVSELNRYYVAAPATQTDDAAILVYEPQL